MRLKPQRRSSRCAIVNRTVSFNVEDPYQQKLLEKSMLFPNFSAAVKRLLAGEPQSFSQPTVPTSSPQVVTSPQPVRDDFDPVSALF